MDPLGQNMASCISAPYLTWKDWYSHVVNEMEQSLDLPFELLDSSDKPQLLTHTDPYVRHVIRKKFLPEE